MFPILKKTMKGSFGGATCLESKEKMLGKFWEKFLLNSHYTVLEALELVEVCGIKVIVTEDTRIEV